MIISTNLTALNSLNSLNRNNNRVSNNIQKLSSGLKINRASDDAAGLAISEKMRAQIRGLHQAQRNIQDGISLVQTAEGGMSEIQSVLQRIRELAVKSANDTNTNEDRELIQKEVTELVRGIDDIANKTEFNRMNLLTGRYDEDGALKESLAEILDYITSDGINDNYNFNGTNYASAIVDFSNLTSASDIAKLDGEGFHYTCATCSKAYSIKFVNGNPDTSRLNDYNPVMEVDISSITNGADLVNSILETAYGQPGFQYDPTNPNLPNTATEFVKHFSQLAVDGGKIYIYDNRPNYAGSTWPTSDGRGVFKPIVYGENNIEDLFLYLKIQDGSNEGNHMELKILNMTIEQLGIEDLKVTTQKEADLVIGQVETAITRVSRGRSLVGAYQNRLEHTHRYVSNSEVNLTTAESRIRDVDMAREMMKFTKNNILAQSAQVLLSQSNQQQQSVLRLLQ